MNALITERLFPRMLEERDFDEYAVIHTDFEVTRFTTRSHLTRMEASLAGRRHLVYGIRADGR